MLIYYLRGLAPPGKIKNLFQKSKVNLGTYNEFRRFSYPSTAYFQTGSFDPFLMIYPNLT